MNAQNQKLRWGPAPSDLEHDLCMDADHRLNSGSPGSETIKDNYTSTKTIHHDNNTRQVTRLAIIIDTLTLSLSLSFFCHHVILRSSHSPTIKMDDCLK